MYRNQSDPLSTALLPLLNSPELVENILKALTSRQEAAQNRAMKEALQFAMGTEAARVTSILNQGCAEGLKVLIQDIRKITNYKG